MGYALCYGSRQCVLAYFFNDGENDCNVGTDEFDQYLGIQQLLSDVQLQLSLIYELLLLLSWSLLSSLLLLLLLLLHLLL